VEPTLACDADDSTLKLGMEFTDGLNFQMRRGSVTDMWYRIMAGMLAAGLAFAVGAEAADMDVKEPANLDPHKAELRHYVDSGRYERDVAAVAAQARKWIEQRVAQGGASLTVVLDLDETLLSNWPEIIGNDFGYNQRIWEDWQESAKAPAIAPVREVVRTARRLGVAVIVLSARKENHRAATERNLHEVGCGNYTTLLLAPDESKATAETFKLAERRRLEAGGAVIIANVGDQESDLAGGHSERTFKLPNPFYLTN
jgi:acid phosphatase